MLIFQITILDLFAMSNYSFHYIFFSLKMFYALRILLFIQKRTSSVFQTRLPYSVPCLKVNFNAKLLSVFQMLAFQRSHLLKITHKTPAEYVTQEIINQIYHILMKYFVSCFSFHRYSNSKNFVLSLKFSNLEMHCSFTILLNLL